jgi:hypothetical protein
MRVSVAFLATTLFLLTSCAKEYTQQELLIYASQQYDKDIFRDTVGQVVPLGKLGQANVVVEYKCSDICPMYTVRVIRFDLPPGLTCKEAGGRYTYFDLPPFSQQPHGGYCVPAVLMDNWDRYVK